MLKKIIIGSASNIDLELCKKRLYGSSICLDNIYKDDQEEMPYVEDCYNLIEIYNSDIEYLKDFKYVDLRYILIEGEIKILKCLRDRGIPFIIAVNNNTNTDYINEILKFNMPILNLSDNQNLYDVLKVEARYDYLLDKIKDAETFELSFDENYMDSFIKNMFYFKPDAD